MTQLKCPLNLGPSDPPIPRRDSNRRAMDSEHFETHPHTQAMLLINNVKLAQWPIKYVCMLGFIWENGHYAKVQ